MSSGGYESYTSVLEGLSQTKLCVVSATALMLYDWMISLDRERSFVWSGRLNVASVLYVLGRLVGPAANIVSMALFSPVNDHVCAVVTDLECVLVLLPYGIWALFASLRAHALSGRKILVTAIVFILNVAPAVFDAYVYFALSRAANYAPPIGCLDSGSQDIETYALIFSYCSRGSITLSELIMLVLTWKGTGIRAVELKSPNAMVGRRSLSGVLFISGISCFGISLFLNVLSLVLANTGNEASEFVALFAHFRDAIISILISRFLLDLLEVRMSTDDSEEERDVLPTDWTEDFHGVHTSASGIAGISCRHGGGSEGFSEALPG